MQEKKIVVVGCFFLPDLVLLVDDHLLLLVELQIGVSVHSAISHNKIRLQTLTQASHHQQKLDQRSPKYHQQKSYLIKKGILIGFLWFGVIIFSFGRMDRSKQDAAKREAAELTIQKALEFAGDNSNYQKKRLLLLTIMILALAILTSKVAMMGSKIILVFLFVSGIGQIVCPNYLNMLAITFGLAAFTIGAALFYPFSEVLTDFCYLGMGFFARGFFVSSLVYFNEIGGDRFRAWSIIVVFAVWGLSFLISSVELMVRLPHWFWMYTLIFIPIIANAYFVFKTWKPSPYFLYSQKMYAEAKMVLNEIADENLRPTLPYALEGEATEDNFIQSKNPSYFEILYGSLLRKTTIPLIVVWIYRQYIYYGSYLIIPELSQEYTKNFILISISETVAVLMSYPIRLKIRRVNAIFGLTVIILICSFICSLSVVDEQCKIKGNVCSMKYIYRVSIMMIRFSIALIGNILINYTLEVYPSNVRNTAYGLLLSVSSLGSIVLPCVNSAFMHAGFSGFIGFAVASAVAVYYVTQLSETYGKMRVQKLEELQNKTPLISLSNWKTLNL